MAKKMIIEGSNKCDGAIFQFDSFSYGQKEVENFSRDTCEKLSNSDVDCVTKFNIDSTTEMECLLNGDVLDTENSYYRVFL